MSLSTLLLWIVLLGVLAWSIFWHMRENQQLAKDWKTKLDSNTSNFLSRFAWSRTIQLIAAFGSCILIIMFYSWNLDSANEANDELSVTLAGMEEKLTQIETEHARKPVNQEPSSVPAQAQYYPPVTEQAPSAASPVAVAPQPQPPAQPTVSDVFAPDESGVDQQTTMDSMKQRYEDILVIYMFLSKCSKTDTADYYIIMSALSQDMASVNAPGRMQSDVVTAAQGSYEEMYAQSDCNSLDINALQDEYTQYIDALKEYSVTP